MKVISTLAALLLATGTTWAQAPATAGGEVTKIDKPGGPHHAAPRRDPQPRHAGHDHGVPRGRPAIAHDVAKVGERVKFTADKRNGQPDGADARTAD